MKQLLITTAFILCGLISNAQDKSKKDSVPPAPKPYYLILLDKDWQALIDFLKTADEKPSIVKAWQQVILTNLKPLEQPKQDTLKQKHK